MPPNDPKLTPEALAQVNAILASNDPQRFAQAYGVVNADLQSTYGGLQLNANDHDVVQWLGIAEQINSGSQSAIALGIRMNNVVASRLEAGKTIGLFGPEQQAASNRIAQGFFNDIMPDGTLPDFATIRQNDVSGGIAELGIGPAGWAGALPTGFQWLSTFNDNSYIDGLTPFQKALAYVERMLTGILLEEYLVGKAGEKIYLRV